MPLKKLSQHSLILVASNVGTALLAFALTLLIARRLGSVALGQYAGVMAWILPLTLLVDAGVSSLITREVAAQPSTAQSYLRAGYPLRWGIGAAVIGMVWLGAPLMVTDAVMVQGLRIAIVMVLIDTLFGNFTAVFRAWGHMSPIFWLNIGLLSGQVLAAWLAVTQGWGIQGVLWGVMLVDAVQLAATWLVWRRYVRLRPPANFNETLIHVPNYRAVVWRSVPFMVGGLLATLQMRSVLLILERLTSAEMVGWYAAASRMIEAARMIPQAMYGALFPALAMLVQYPASLKRTFRWAMIAMLMYGGSVLVAVIVAGQWLLMTIFGAEFGVASSTLVILAGGLILGLLRGLLTLWYYALQHEKRANQLAAIALVGQLVLGGVLINHWDMLGAAWTVLGGELGLVGMMIAKRPRLSV